MTKSCQLPRAQIRLLMPIFKSKTLGKFNSDCGFLVHLVKPSKKKKFLSITSKTHFNY